MKNLGCSAYSPLRAVLIIRFQVEHSYGIIYLEFRTRIVRKPFVVQNKSATIDVVRLRVNVQYFSGWFSFQIHIKNFEVKTTRHLSVSIYFVFLFFTNDMLHLKRWAWQYFLSTQSFLLENGSWITTINIPVHRIRCYTLSKDPNMYSTLKIFCLKGFSDVASSHPIHYAYWNYFCYFFFIHDDFFFIIFRFEGSANLYLVNDKSWAFII